MLIGEAVAESGRVAHQLAHGRRALHVLDRPAAVFIGPAHDFQRLELRHELGDRIVQLPSPVLEQHHHRDAGDRLRHGVEAEDGVARQRRAGREALDAVELLGDDLTVTREQRRHAGDAPVGDGLCHVGVEFREALRVEAQGFRAGRRIERGRGRTRGAGGRGRRWRPGGLGARVPRGRERHGDEHSCGGDRRAAKHQNLL